MILCVPSNKLVILHPRVSHADCSGSRDCLRNRPASLVGTSLYSHVLGSWREGGGGYRVIILKREHAFARKREETDANFPDQNVQRHSVTSLDTALSLGNGTSWGGGGGLREESVGGA